MIDERMESGPELRLRPHGVGRFFPAAFLLVWLGGWAVGECAVLWILVRGAASMLKGVPVRSGHATLPLMAALAIGAFLLFWLSLWTLGGFAAWRELLRLLWAEDVFNVGTDGLTITHRLGPFRTRRQIPSGELLAIAVKPRKGVIVGSTARTEIVLSNLGAREERERVATWLRQHLRLGEATSSDEPGALPPGWQEITTPEGPAALVSNLRTRATQARTAGVIAALMMALAVVQGREAIRNPSLVPSVVLLGIVAAALVWGTLWLARGRMEWRIGSGRLTLVRRYGSDLREVMEALALEVTMTRDSDGDEWFALEALRDASSAPLPAPAVQRRRILHVMNDASAPRRLGAWLAQRAQVPLVDKTTTEARAVDLAELRARLEQSGKLGRLAARFLERVDKNRVA